jgi:quercetin dioxygenase-like cupin family protein
MSCGTLQLERGKNLNIGLDFSGAGLHVKVTTIPKGMRLVQHKHTYDHLSVLLSGRVIVKSDADTLVIDAGDSPKSLVIEAGRLHSVVALTDAVWLCVHKEEEPCLYNEVA